MNEQTVFDLDYAGQKFTALNLSLVDADGLAIDRYLSSYNPKDGKDDRIPFLRWLASRAAVPDTSILLRLQQFVSGMYCLAISREVPAKPVILPSTLFDNDKALPSLEKFLNAMGVPCRLSVESTGYDQRELYFLYQSGRKLPFHIAASSGTMDLVYFWMCLFCASNAIPPFAQSSLFFFDEFDAFFHYGLSEKIVKYVKEALPDTQIIFTTHNIHLLSNLLMRPDCLLILSQRGQLTPLFRATNRKLIQAHDLQEMYVSGEFERYE